MSSLRNTLKAGLAALALGGSTVAVIPTSGSTAFAAPATAVTQPVLQPTPQPFWRATPGRAPLTPTVSLTATAPQTA